MTCKELEGLTTEYLEEALASPKRLDFEAHLKACPTCQKYIGEMRALIEASHKLGVKLNEEWRAEAAQTQEEFYENLQAGALRKPSVAKERFRKLAPAAALAVIAVVIGGIWIHQRSVTRTPRNLTIDLSEWLNLRGPHQQVHKPVQLARAPLNLTIRLPLGNQPGEYQVAIRQGGTIIVRGNAEGKFENYITTLHVQLDCSNLKAGNYSLLIREPGSEWQKFPAVVP